MGRLRCETQGKCVTGMIASNPMETLHRTLEEFRKGGDTGIQVEITVIGSETVKFCHAFDDIDELVELVRLSTGN